MTWSLSSRLRPQRLGGRVQPAALDDAGHDLPVPHVAHRGRRDRLAQFLHPQDHVDVLLAPAADAEEADAGPLVGGLDARSCCAGSVIAAPTAAVLPAMNARRLTEFERMRGFSECGM